MSRQVSIQNVLRLAVSTLILLAALAIALLPIAWIVLTSFKPAVDWIADPPIWIPSEWTLSNYSKMWDDGGGGALLNSVLIVGISTVLAMGLGCLAAFSFSRFHTGGRHVLAWILSVKFLPPVIFAVPLLIMFTELHLYNSLFGLVLLYTTFQLPFVVWMMKGFFDEVPREIEESARVDGCSWMGVLWRFTLPLAAPGLVATAVLTFVFGWAEFFLPLVFANQENFPLTVQLAAYFSESQGLEWGPQAALSVVGLVPMVIAALAIQRYLIRGMTFGAVKG